ncbi:DUF2156 domain-containing protein [Legionella sp. PATHC035]|uniref:GNAT family N-acetyltransferase n=1 Tax=Legionella sp. PATHC035 TaxID=2992040 RepID=UPI002243FF0E|nr:GNAT family N-acetyltransferase [Legionella sp. PATHC035]MCW8409213.1 DUF2156 domain-containing protein [Legionella sp. PATHC035]
MMNRQLPNFFEGRDWLSLYLKHPDPQFLPQEINLEDNSSTYVFLGKVNLSNLLETSIPLPSLSVLFWGNPITDLFPACNSTNEIEMQIEKVFNLAKSQNVSAIAVKDLPDGHFLEESLIKREFIPIEHDPIWYYKVPMSLDEFFFTLSKGRRRGLKNRWMRFQKMVQVREATPNDISFIMTAYEHTWQKAVLKLEKLTIDFYLAALRNEHCKIFIYEHNNTPFAFTLLYLKDQMIFDKYIGSIPALAYQFSFYSMSMLYILDWAKKQGFQWYVAGQGSGESKRALGFSAIPCKIWTKPLKLTRVLMLLSNRIIKTHSKRIRCI